MTVKIKDGEGRIWEVTTDANRDIVAQAIKFLKEIYNCRMCELANLLNGYGYEFECNLIDQSVDFEM
jgi:hypothetical protein